MSGNVHHVFLDNLVDETGTRREAGDREHVGYFEDLTLDLLAVLSLILEFLRKVLSRQALEVGKSVVQRDGKSSEDELAGKLLLLEDSESDVTLDSFDQVEESVGVEHVVLALEEDLAHVLEVGQKVDLLGLLGVEVLDELEDSLTGLESILPDFHVKRILELLGSQLEELDDAVFLVKADGVRDLVRLDRVGLLLLLEDLTVVVVEGLSESDELLAALEPSAEVEE